MPTQNPQILGLEVLGYYYMTEIDESIDNNGHNNGPKLGSDEKWHGACGVQVRLNGSANVGRIRRYGVTGTKARVMRNSHGRTSVENN
jgi:hypothetical protein